MVVAVALVVVGTTEAAKGAPAVSAESAAAREEAKKRYKRGIQLFEEGSYEAAMLEFRRAYTLSPSWKILYNIGMVNVQLRDYAAAIDDLEQYLAGGGAEIPGERQQEVRSQLEDLAGRVATITVVVDVPGAEVTVDDLPIGTTPLAAPIRVNTGRRRVVVSAPRHLPVTRIVELAGGDARTLRFELRSLVDDSPRREVASRPIPWAWWGTTAVLAAGATTSGLFAMSAARDYDGLRAREVSAGELDRAHTRLRAWSIATDVLAVAAVASASWSLYLTLREPERPVKSSAPTAGLALLPGGAFVSLQVAR
jgi:tetratricopeptide (TPR) repeat protein